MRASTRASPPEAKAHPGPRRTLAGDSAGVSEVIGFLLTFGILAAMLVMSMYAFGAASRGAREQAVELHAQSAATRVAGVVVEIAVLAEQHGASAPAVAYALDLPNNLESYDYDIAIEAANDQGTVTTADDTPDRVVVTVEALSITVTAPIFSAAAPANVAICSTEVSGGSIVVLYDDPTVDDPDLPGDRITVNDPEFPGDETVCPKSIFLGVGL